MKDIKEIRDWLLENAVNSYGDLVLNGLDFSDFAGDIYIGYMKVQGNLTQSDHDVQGNLYQSNHDVQGELYQSNHKVHGELSQSNHKVQGDLRQSGHKVQGDLYQSDHDVIGDLINIYNKYGGNLYETTPVKHEYLQTIDYTGIYPKDEKSNKATED